MQKNKEFIVFGHRGAPDLKTENTVESFNLAIDLGLDGIELDVMLSKDKKIIIFHDNVIENLFISELTYDQIKLYNPDIPLLEDLIKNIYKKNIIINIEIKSNHFFSDGIEQQLIQLIYKYDIQSKIILSSFDVLVLLRIKLINYNLRLGFIIDKNNIIKFYAAKILKPYSIHLNIDFLNNKIVSNFKHLNFKIYIWTVKEQNLKSLYKNKNIDGVFIDNPNILKVIK